MDGVVGIQYFNLLARGGYGFSRGSRAAALLELATASTRARLIAT